MGGKIDFETSNPLPVTRTGSTEGSAEPGVAKYRYSDRTYDSASATANPFTEMDISVQLFQVLAMQATSADEDLRDLIGRLRDNNAKKAEVRKLQGIWRQIESISGHQDAKPSAEDLERLEGLKAEFARIMEANGFGDGSSLASLSGDFPDPTSTSRDDMSKFFTRVRDELDALQANFNGIGEETGIALQAAMAAKTRVETAQTRTMKTLDEAARAVINNL